ncbi:MAG: hypothetical protein JW927_18525 [Deltaproteobacteria bacterium]|nr:hypothetical protein [Deltaproteobacteria bacterium]
MKIIIIPILLLCTAFAASCSIKTDESIEYIQCDKENAEDKITFHYDIPKYNIRGIENFFMKKRTDGESVDMDEFTTTDDGQYMSTMVDCEFDIRSKYLRIIVSGYVIDYDHNKYDFKEKIKVPFNKDVSGKRGKVKYKAEWHKLTPNE